MGKFIFGEYERRFYAWTENLATQVSRLVFVWINLEGLPLQCWGKTEIKKIVRKFGKVLKISQNVYQKFSLDVARVMVEVEDILRMPKMVSCSYKAISDEAIRTFEVKLIISSHCLPCSQTRKLQAVRGRGGGGGGTGMVEWIILGQREDTGVAKDVLTIEMKEAAARAVGEPDVVSDNQEPSTMAEEEASVQQRARSRAHCVGEVQISNKVHEADMQAEFSERERRRKGNGLMGVADAGQKWVHKANGQQLKNLGLKWPQEHYGP